MSADGLGVAQEFEPQKPRPKKVNGHGPPENEEPRERKPRFPIVIWDALSSLPEHKPLVHGLLDQGSMSVFYGGSDSGKTFVLIDLGVSVARGEEWCGRKVQQGAVVYVAAEGGLSIRKRLVALAKHRDIEPGETPFYVMPAALDMGGTAKDTHDLAADIAAIVGQHVALVIIDTLSRVMMGANENASDGMGAFVANCDRLRQTLNAHVAVIHHTGKDEGRGARGHSLLRAAADTEIEISKDETKTIVTATVTKQRDHRSGDAFSWCCEEIEIGRDEDDKPITSLVVVPTGSVGAKRTKGKGIGPVGRTALAMLHDAVSRGAITAPPSDHVPTGAQGVTKALFRSYLEKGGVINAEGNPREQLKRILVTLKDAGVIGVWDDFVWPVTKRHKVSQ
jgi:hypothetical protein